MLTVSTVCMTANSDRRTRNGAGTDVRALQQVEFRSIWFARKNCPRATSAERFEMQRICRGPPSVTSHLREGFRERCASADNDTINYFDSLSVSIVHVCTVLAALTSSARNYGGFYSIMKCREFSPIWIHVSLKWLCNFFIRQYTINCFLKITLRRKRVHEEFVSWMSILGLVVDLYTYSWFKWHVASWLPVPTIGCDHSLKTVRWCRS